MSVIRLWSPRQGALEGFTWPLTGVIPGTLNTAAINECWLWGHSYVGGNIGMISGYGDDPLVGHPWGLDDYLFAGLDLSWPAARTHGQSGAQLYGWVGNAIMNYGLLVPENRGLVHSYNQGIGPYLSEHGAHVFVIGANDVAIQGDPAAEGDRAGNLWRASVQSTCAWLRLGAYFPAYQLYSAGAPEGGTEVASKYAGTTYGAGWTRTPPVGVAKTSGNGGLDIFNNTFYPADGYMQTTTTGAIATLRVPADHPGTDVWAFFIGEAGATGASTASIGGVTFSTNDIVKNPQLQAGIFPNYAIVSVKVPMARTGAIQTITLNAGTLGGGKMLRFCGFGLEAVDPKLITWGTVPIPKFWHGGTGAYAPDAGGGSVRSGAQAGDGWAATLDGLTGAVASSFAPAGSVCVADLGAFNGITSPWLFRDLIHPTREGNAVMANGLLMGMNVTPLTFTNLSSRGTQRELVEQMLGTP